MNTFAFMNIPEKSSAAKCILTPLLSPQGLYYTKSRVAYGKTMLILVLILVVSQINRAIHAMYNVHAYIVVHSCLYYIGPMLALAYFFLSSVTNSFRKMVTTCLTK